MAIIGTLPWLHGRSNASFRRTSVVWILAIHVAHCLQSGLDHHPDNGSNATPQMQSKRQRSRAVWNYPPCAELELLDEWSLPTTAATH